MPTAGEAIPRMHRTLVVVSDMQFCGCFFCVHTAGKSFLRLPWTVMVVSDVLFLCFAILDYVSTAGEAILRMQKFCF